MHVQFCKSKACDPRDSRSATTDRRQATVTEVGDRSRKQRRLTHTDTILARVHMIISARSCGTRYIIQTDRIPVREMPKCHARFDPSSRDPCSNRVARYPPLSIFLASNHLLLVLLCFCWDEDVLHVDRGFSDLASMEIDRSIPCLAPD